MADTNLKTGFYANETEVFFVSESGRAWIVASPDIDRVEEIAANDFPADATSADGLVNDDFAAELKEIAELESAN